MSSDEIMAAIHRSLGRIEGVQQEMLADVKSLKESQPRTIERINELEGRVKWGYGWAAGAGFGGAGLFALLRGKLGL